SGARHRVQWLHDVQARLDQLGSIDYLARNWADSLFQLQPLPQPSAAERALDHLVSLKIWHARVSRPPVRSGYHDSALASSFPAAIRQACPNSLYAASLSSCAARRSWIVSPSSALCFISCFILWPFWGCVFRLPGCSSS